MLFGVRFINFLGSAKKTLAMAELAEKEGFDFCWFPHDTLMANTWVMTSAVAARTKRIKLGSVGTNPYSTDPSEIATYAATLSEIAPSRVVLGLGLHTEQMLGWLGIKTSDMEGRIKEAVSLLRKLLAGKVAKHNGKHFHWSDQAYLRFDSLPAKVPIYLAGFAPRHHELSGEIGDGSLPMITPPESATYVVECIRRGARRKGRKPQDIDIAGLAWLSVSKNGRVAEKILRRMIAYFGPYLEPQALQAIGLTPKDFDEIKFELMSGSSANAQKLVSERMMRLAIIGGPDEVIQAVDRLQHDGITQVSFGGPLGPDPKEAIRLVGRKVIPYFREHGTR